MINTIAPYRRLLATILSCWMSLIVISGIVFMHKEVTSKGEIITHVHPYDFTKQKDKHQHKNDAEIQFLNVIFQGSFTEAEFYVFQVPFFQEYSTKVDDVYVEQYQAPTFQHVYLRGPPVLV